MDDVVSGGPSFKKSKLVKLDNDNNYISKKYTKKRYRTKTQKYTKSKLFTCLSLLLIKKSLKMQKSI